MMPQEILALRICFCDSDLDRRYHLAFRPTGLVSSVIFLSQINLVCLLQLTILDYGIQDIPQWSPRLQPPQGGQLFQLRPLTSTDTPTPSSAMMPQETFGTVGECERDDKDIVDLLLRPLSSPAAGTVAGSVQVNALNPVPGFWYWNLLMDGVP